MPTLWNDWFCCVNKNRQYLLSTVRAINFKFNIMKKLFLLVAVSLIGITSFAQDETVIEIQDKNGPYITGGFWDNWFISAGGGVQVYFGKSDNHGDLGQRLAPALDISLGKWITPSVGVRLQYSGLQAKGFSYGNLPFSEGRADNQGYYKEKFNTMNLHGDFMWNISNAIGGEVGRFWNFVPFVGFGWARANGNDVTNNEFAANVGLLHNLRISDALDVNIEMKSMLVNQRFAGTTNGKTLNALAGITAGLTYYFGGTRGFQRASDLIVVEDNTQYVQEIAALEGMLAKAEQKRAALQKQLDAQTAELNQVQNVEATVPVLPSLAIFFEIGKANLTEKAIINIGYIADVLKQFPEKKFVLYASADKETGTPKFNMELSQKRGQAVYKVMTEKYGISPDQLRIDAVGSSVQKFDGAQLNRVVVIEDKE